MGKRAFHNKLNDLDPKTWLKFQKSWFLHNPPPRRRDVLRHPAKFPETLAQEFIEFFTKSGDVVLDPMVGTGSTSVAALRSGRHSYGIELNSTYASIARSIVNEERTMLVEKGDALVAEIICGNAIHIGEYALTYKIPLINYVFTSPPYWDMLHMRGAMAQKKRRLEPELDIVYSDDADDLGNISDYDEFIERLAAVYETLQPLLKPKAYMTIVVKNIKKGGKIYPLAWDLARRLEKSYSLKDEKIWLQDNQRLAPYGLGNAWVSNTFHHYCLQFRNERDASIQET